MLQCNYKSKKNLDFRTIVDPRKLLKNIKYSKITLQDAKTFKEDLNQTYKI